MELSGVRRAHCGRERNCKFIKGISRQERSKWRLTCKRLVEEATILL